MHGREAYPRRDRRARRACRQNLRAVWTQALARAGSPQRERGSGLPEPSAGAALPVLRRIEGLGRGRAGAVRFDADDLVVERVLLEIARLVAIGVAGHRAAHRAAVPAASGGSWPLVLMRSPVAVVTEPQQATHLWTTRHGTCIARCTCCESPRSTTWPQPPAHSPPAPPRRAADRRHHDADRPTMPKPVSCSTASTSCARCTPTPTADSPLIENLCAVLTAHTMIEEELFYPAARQAIAEARLLDHAIEDHARAKELIAQLVDASASDALFNTRVHLLRDAIERHVAQEEEPSCSRRCARRPRPAGDGAEDGRAQGRDPRGQALRSRAPDRAAPARRAALPPG